MLPETAPDESNCGVSYHRCSVALEENGLVSKAKNAKTLSFQIGPPRLPPQLLKREGSRLTPLEAARAAAVVPVGALFDCVPFQRWNAFNPGREALKNALPWTLLVPLFVVT